VKLKKLQLQGFKSFADRTELNFDRQIAAVVGPNGCGKSNIVDAIRWAMGEQSAKGLRGNDMADVIFAGTPVRKNSNVAEVSLVFDNADRLAPPPYTDVAEVMITRRLFRSGESEYLINKVVCRLKDVNDLFLGTGSSAKAYSIVAQGKVDQVVLAKPEDRRFLIEEAAGVAKYKVRKQSAERKMDATKHNLERVHDILLELEKNARSLERQVEKAEKFREIQRDLRQVDEKVVNLKVKRIDSSAAQNDDSLLKSKNDFQATSTQLLEKETSLESVRLSILNFEKRLATEMDSLLRRREEAARFEMDAELAAQRVSMLENQVADRSKDVERLQAKHRDQEGAKEGLVRERNNLESEKASKESLGETKKLAIREIEEAIQISKDKISEVQAEIQRLRSEAVARKERAELLKADRVNQELKWAEFESMSESLRAEGVRIEASLSQLQQNRAEGQAKLEEVEANLSDTRLRLEATNVSLGSQFEAKAKVQGELSEFKNALESLETLEQHQVGYDLSALEFKKESNSPFLLELIQLRTDQRALGEKILFQLGQYFLEEGSTNDQGSRRSSILKTGTPTSYSRSAWDLVESVSRPELEDFLRSIEWLDNIQNQDHACFDSEGRLLLPLTQGYSIHQTGTVKREHSPFSRRAEADQLERLLQEATSRLSDLEQQIQDTQTQLANLKAQIRTLEDQVRVDRQRLTVADQQIRHEDARRSKSDARLEETQAEMARLDIKIRELEGAIRQIPNDESVLISETELGARKSELRSLEIHKSQMDGDWVEFRIELGALLERLDRLQERSIQAAMAQTEYQHNEGIYRQDIVLWNEEITRLNTKGQACRDEQKAARDESLRLEQSVALVKEETAKLQTRVDEEELDRRGLQVAKDHLQKQLQELELERQNLKFQVEELSQIVHERYQLSLAEFIQSLPVQTEDEELDGGQLQSSGGVDLASLEERSKLLRDRIARFGDVNLVALQEFEEIKKRLEFMTHQKTDLLKTLESLQSIIDRINKITEFRFRETFRAINHNFQILFPKLFGGGKAYMSLTNENNLLESGVEIFAEPPGKKVQVMSLLSGGEKAMTSISLLFSLFSYRPSSFCILDEVDAPLDDLNTRRYNEIIEEMAGLSQFIVITHNKRTMEVAQTMFGVTMQEPGVSKLVGVNLAEARAFSGTSARSA